MGNRDADLARMRIAVVGASGFVGSKLAPHLAALGHTVVTVGRDASRLPSGRNMESRPTDLSDGAATRDALAGCDAAFYLVHSMAGDASFAERDLELANGFAAAAHDRGVRRIVYVGALGSDDLSDHLSSRQDVGRALASAGADVVELRAAVVLGAGSISFEMMRYLVERLPLMVAPRWLRTKIQPIALPDLLRYLVRSLDVPPGTYEIGSEVTTYRDLIDRFAQVRGLRRRFILDVPLLSLSLSAYWVDLVTPVDRRVSHALIGSLASEVVVHHREKTDQAFGITPMSIDEALAEALDEQERAVVTHLFEIPQGLRDNVYTAREDAEVDETTAKEVVRDLTLVGGSLDWYGIAAAWRLRNLFGRLVGERASLVRPDRLETGVDVDWWRVARAGDRELVLRSRGWWPGEGWIGYRVEDAAVRIATAFRPKGVPGFLYWQLLRPVHRVTTKRMLRHRITRAQR